MPNDSPDWTQNIARPQTVAPGSPWNFTNAGITENIPLTPDVYTIGFLTSSLAPYASLKVTGHESGAIYLLVASTGGPAPSPVQWVPVMPAVDTSVDITLTATGNGTLYAVLMGESAGVINYPANGVTPVRLTGIGSQVSVDQTEGTANPWLHPTNIKYLNTGNLVAGGSFTAIPAVAGEQIYLFHMCLQPVDGGLDADVFDGTATGTPIDAFIQAFVGTPTNQYPGQMPPHHYDGVALTAGNPLTIANGGTGTHGWQGYVTYSQA